MEPCFPGNVCTSAWWREEVSKFLILFWLHSQFLLYLLNCLCLNPQVLSLLPFSSSPHPIWGEWASSFVVLSSLLGLNYNRKKKSKAQTGGNNLPNITHQSMSKYENQAQCDLQRATNFLFFLNCHQFKWHICLWRWCRCSYRVPWETTVSSNTR